MVLIIDDCAWVKARNESLYDELDKELKDIMGSINYRAMITLQSFDIMGLQDIICLLFTSF